MCEESPCHICGEITEFICEDCEEYVCEDCAVPYTPQNNCEGTHCSECYDTSQRQWIEYCQKLEIEEEIRREKRERRNAAARKRYNSPEQVEKRRVIKKKRIEESIKRDIERAEEMGNILKGWLR
jgi:hypothetical protein